jgi:Protein of unknown function (DUF3307)
MTLELALIIGFIFHFVGDYLLQNDWMAQNKTKDNLPALIHAFIYSLPFCALLTGKHHGFNYCLQIVFVTHFFIDRFRLATYWIKLMNWNWQSTNFGYDNNKPAFMSIWLMIIIDNTFHIIFNSIAIYLYFR